jgi:S-adenosylmethionine hydrolase
MKGVILGLFPDAQLIDLTHEVPPQAVITGAFLLRSAIDYFPKGTVHLAVVDPGVGSARKPIAVKSKGQFFVGPDNGLFPAVLKSRGIDEIVELTEKKYQLKEPSSTFHGRDVFAPVAAHLAKGVPLGRVGKRLSNLIWREIPKPFKAASGWTGEVMWIDRFGNLITNFEKRHLSKPFRLKIGKTVVLSMANHYAEAKRGTVIALLGSSGNLEISVNGGNAAQKLSVGIGATTVLC